MPQAIDAAGNIWETDATGNAVRFLGRAGPAPQAQVIGTPRVDPYKAADDRRADAALQLQRENAARDAAKDVRPDKPTLPPGYGWNDPADPSKGMSLLPGAPAPKDQGDEKDRLGRLKALASQIKRVEELYQAGPGTTKGVKGVADYLPTDSNAAFDTAGAQLSQMGLAAFRVPGTGTISDRDAIMFDKANLPTAGTRDASIQEQLRGIKARVDEEISTLGQPKVDWTIATGAARSVPDAEGDKLAMMLLRSGASDDDINGALRERGIGAIANLPQLREFYQKNPAAPDAKGVLRTVPTTAVERALASPTGAFIGNALNSAAGGIPTALAGQEGVDALNMLNDANPKAALGGQVVGGVGAMLGAGKLLNMTKLAPWIAGNAGKASAIGDAAYGALYGANTADEGEALQGAGFGAAAGLIGNGIGNVGARALGGITRGAVNPSASYLASRQIPLTGGQTMGGFVKGLEDKATSLPVIGDLINARRLEGVDAFNRAAFEEAGQPIGFTPTRTQDAGIQDLRAATGNAYDDAVQGVTVPLDPRFNSEYIAAKGRGAILPPDLASKFDLAMTNRIDPAIATGQLYGTEYQQAVRGLKSYKAEATKPGFEQDYRDALTGVQDTLTGAMTRNGGDSVVTGLANADQSYKRMKVLEDAVKRARGGVSGDVETFTPSQLNNAAEANRFAGTGSARPFYELGKAGQEVLPSKIPDSGTAGRGLQALALGGGLGATGGLDYATGADGSVAAPSVGAMALMAALNTKAGQKAFTAALKRPDSMVKAGNYLTDKSPYAGLLMGALGTGLAQ